MTISEWLPLVLGGGTLITGIFTLIKARLEHNHLKELRKEDREDKNKVLETLMTDNHINICSQLTQMKVDLDEQDIQINKKIDSLATELLNVMEMSALLQEGQVSLLRDRLAEGYHKYKDGSKMGSSEYHALCDTHSIYHKHGGNSYADQIMANIHELYRQQPFKERDITWENH